MIHVKQLFTIFCAITIVAACSKNDDFENPKTATTLSLKNPEGLSNVQVVDGTVTVKEINSGAVNNSGVINNGAFTLSLSPGSYSVTFEGNIQYTVNGVEKKTQARAYKEGVVINGSTLDIVLDLFVYDATSSFVIKEIFFTGTLTPQDKVYNGDKYVTIFNNSDKVQYADGLILADSHFLTTTKRSYTPDIMNQAFTSRSMIQIPGDGDDYPIQPGAAFTIANNAINHKEFNTNSLDLSKADFELDLLPAINVDNPQVPNAINIADYMTMHNRGFKSFVLARLDKSVDKFKTENFYTTSYTNSTGGQTSAQVYRIDNSTILDAVNLSVAASFEWIVTAPSLDMGWTYCGKIDGDATRYGKSVIRKVAGTGSGGRVVLMDTNNSTADFIPESKPSLF